MIIWKVTLVFELNQVSWRYFHDISFSNAAFMITLSSSNIIITLLSKVSLFHNHVITRLNRFLPFHLVTTIISPFFNFFFLITFQFAQTRLFWFCIAIVISVIIMKLYHFHDNDYHLAVQLFPSNHFLQNILINLR